MIRVYAALFGARRVGLGLGLSQPAGPVLFTGAVLGALAAIGLHAHYTSER